MSEASTGETRGTECLMRPSDPTHETQPDAEAEQHKLQTSGIAAPREMP
jgi:hypothetical protein